ncbi:AtzE family amidohydrolase (plasmid) [Acidithiobacillus caldus]|nr:AtzE family amidohydrolase [Acidithiobacillus caldus]AUW34250.1 AtzE family amidohydrolase [Acidithiobacillus caldus]
MSATEIAERVRTGSLTARAVVDHTLERIAAQNPRLNAFTLVTAERACQKATQVDQLVATGHDPGPLAGVPFAVKNLFDIQGEVTLAGSKINRDLPPALQDSTLVRRLSAAGAILVGALNMGEYAYDFTGENLHYGASRNPHDLSRMTGGSSGGSGSAVAGGLVPLALGSDTNGSIRVPSSLCGIFGLKPTYGRLSRGGSFPFCPSLDHVGPMARSAQDLALAYDALQGPDDRDAALVRRSVEPVGTLTTELDSNLRIAVLGGYFAQQGTDAARRALQRVADALGVKSTIEIPEVAAARAAAYVVTNAESSALHLPNLRTRPHDYDPDVRDRMLAGALLPATAYLQAQRVRAHFQKIVADVLTRHDILLAPATPMTAPSIGQKTMVLGGEEMLVRPHLGLYTQPFSFIGLPVVVVPVQLPDSLPIGVQVIAGPWQEARALQVARVLEDRGFVSPIPYF